MRLRHEAGVWELFVPRLACGELACRDLACRELARGGLASGRRRTPAAAGAAIIRRSPVTCVTTTAR